MKVVADLHTHSHYSRATSPSLSFTTLAQWAKYKGIGLLSSADFTHPKWFEETKKNLKESAGNLYEYDGIKFILGTEISCIFVQGSRQRRIHLLVFAPTFETVEKINQRLGRVGNLGADGRPILGISAKELLKLLLEVDPRIFVIPAHAWTPWYSLYGSNSGFDSIEECFGDLSKYIYAIETGLSSDPKMNWRIPELDNRSIVSFSDAHSVPKLGRELTVFDCELTYDGILEALKKQKISFTIEFFPEEGKYHYTGHRSCRVRHSPEETAKLGVICPKCQRKLTVGVMHRVETLAKRKPGFKPKERPPYKMLVPLLEILAEALNSQVSSDKAMNEYLNLVNNLGSEVSILMKIPTEEIERITFHPKVAEGIERVRSGNIVIEPGFDGVFGKVKIWPEAEKLTNKQVSDGQIGLF